jgi:c-di-GMP-binding flagellar brake protein YcgR
MAPTQQAQACQSKYKFAERRVKTRYDLALELSYCVLGGTRSGEAGRGRTIDVSSAALRFAAERPLGNGLGMEIVVDWPTLLDGRVPLQLIATGLVVRTHGTDTVVKIERYVFKTRKAR